MAISLLAVARSRAARTRAGSDGIIVRPVADRDTIYVYNTDGTLSAFRVP